MPFIADVLHVVAGLMFERPVRGLSAQALIDRLDASTTPFVTAVRTKTDTTANRVLLAHIIGIECWAQNRMRQGANGTVVFDESDSYTPSPAQPMVDLVALAAATRAQSVALLRELTAAGTAPATTIAHNQFGALSLAAWSQYIVSHANLEAKKMR